MLYFAYGSNMLIERIRQPDRAPTANPVAVGHLPGYTLRFHKRSLDGSGKASLAAGGDDDRVWGVLYDVEDAERGGLDLAEGLGAGYEVSEGVAETAAGPMDVWYYDADPEFVDPSLVPYLWYRDLVHAGAEQHGLPADYVAAIAAARGEEDPDRRRAQRARRLLLERSRERA